MLPVTTTIGLQTGALLAGAVLTESVFAFNGIGSYLFDAISGLDFAVLQGFILFIAVIYALVNLVVDLLYGVIDPRLRPREADPVTALDTLRPERPHALAQLMGDRGADERGTSLWQGAFQRLRRNPSADRRRRHRGRVRAGGGLRAADRPVRAASEPSGSSRSRRSSVPGRSPEHLLGLDPFGSDLFTQLVYGARQSLIIGVVSTTLGLLGGAVLGTLAGGLGGWVDTLGDAGGRHPAVHPVAAARGERRRGAGAAAQRDHDRHRRRAGADLRPAAARLDAGPARPGLRAGRRSRWGCGGARS